MEKGEISRFDNARDNDIIIIAISGPSSSGKTTVTKNLVKLFNHCKVIHQDDFYKPDDEIPLDEKTGEQNWDHPNAINFEKLKNYIKSIRNHCGGDVTLEHDKIDSLELDIDLKLSHDEITNFQATLERLNQHQIIIVDGFMLYHDEELMKLFDIKLFFYSTYEVLKLRRSKRKGYSTISGFWVDPPNYFDDFVWPAYEKFHKHLFIDNDVNRTLNDYATKFSIKGYLNDDNSSLNDMIKWSLDQMILYIDDGN